MPTRFASPHAACLSVSPHSHPLRLARPHRLKALPVALVTAAGLSLGLVGIAAQAATIVVNSGGDTSGTSVCTLRDAFTLMTNGALSAGSGCTLASGSFGTSDTITFANTVTSVSLTQGSLSFNNTTPNASLLVQGRGQGGVTITRPTSSPTFPLIVQYYGGGLTLDGITLTGGQGSSGGAVQFSNVITGLAKFQLKNSVVTGNKTTIGGAGIFVRSSATQKVEVTITNSTISNNQAVGGNAAIDGAGIYLVGPTVLIMTGSTVSGNGSSGGIRNGGGIYASDGATMTLTNSTVSGNAANCQGSGLYGAMSVNNTAASVTLTNVTLAANTQAGQCAGSGALFQTSGSITLNNTLIAGNLANSVAADMASNTALNVAGNNNLVRNVASTVTFTNAPLTSNPLLGPLADNGGATFTHALISSSPAIDAGSSTSTLTTDQRGVGFPRLSGNAVDIGAYESSSVAINGLCGSASSSTPVLSAPTTNLCSTGTATAVSGTGPWTWGCNGSGGGTSTSATACSVPIQTWSVTPSVATGAASGSISPAQNNTPSGSATFVERSKEAQSYAVAIAVSVNNNATSTFTLTPANGYTTSSVIGCNGTFSAGSTSYTTGRVTADCNVVASFVLTPVNGACGSASSSTPVLSAPTTNLCSTGTNTVVNGPNPSNFTWGCTGNATGTSTSATACSVPIQTWSVTPSVATGAVSGAISPTTAVSVNNNTTSTFTLTPAAGYTTTSVTGCNGTFSAGSTSYITGPVTASCNVVASFALTPINGLCGSASSSTPVLSAPTANLCSTGTATAVSGTGPWTWGCNGSGGGTSTSATACSVPIQTWSVTPSVATGASSGSISPSTTVSVNNNTTSTFTLTPATGYVTTSVTGCNGTFSAGSTSYITGPVTASCNVVASFALTPINGLCGTASSSTPVLSAPTANLCSTGTATAVSGTGPWTWGCNGNATGTSTSAAACSVGITTWSITPSVATGAVSGAISPATAVSVNNNTTSTFTLTPAAGYTTTSVTGCNGTFSAGSTSYITGPVTASCNVVASFALTPINGLCGSASSSSMTALVAPSANLCSTGTATTVNGNGPWTWGCNGNATGTSTSAAACSVGITTWSVTPSVATGAVSGAISPATAVSVNNNTTSTFTLTPAAGYVTTSVTGCNGTFSAGSTSYITGPVTASCNVVASFALTPINGLCGSASSSSMTALVAPSANLCSTGTATTVNGNGPWTWGCNGNATGTSTSAAACSVGITTWSVTPSVATGAVSGAISPATAVSVNNNTTSTFTLTPAAGYATTSVTGCNGTFSAGSTSYITGPVTASCNVIASFALILINGLCGTASGGAPAVMAPSANLCSTGTATTVNGSGPWTWGCNGNATGSSTAAAACSTAIKTWTVTPSVSGGNGAIAPSTAVSVNNNAATSFTVTPASGYNIASVIGCGGTRDGTAFNIVAVTADCSVVAMFAAKPGSKVTFSGNNTTIPNGTGAPTNVAGTDFGTRTTGQYAVNSFVLANNGATPLTITSMSFTGAQATDFTITSPTAFPVIVNAGASLTFSVRFTPSAPGLRSAALAIALDDGVAGGSANPSHLKAMATVGFAVQGIGVEDVPVLVPVPAWGLGGLMASLLGLMLTGFAALRRRAK